MQIAPSHITGSSAPHSRALPAMATIAAGTVAVQFAAPLALSPAAETFVMSSGFTAFALIGGIVVAIAPVLAFAFMIRNARPSRRDQPEIGE